MSKVVRTILAGLPLVIVPAVAAEPAPNTGIASVVGSIGTALFLFALAAALASILVFRRSATALARMAVRRLGEFRIRRALARDSEAVLHDFVLPGAYGGLISIDHAAMTASGILCIQSKHYNGVVSGDRDEPQWTHVDGSSRRRFLNPLIQNEGRSRALKKVVPDVPVTNLVVFTGKVEFPSAPPANVIHVGELESYIAKCAKCVSGPNRIEDRDTAWLSLEAAALTDEATRKDLAAQLGFG